MRSEKSLHLLLRRMGDRRGFGVGLQIPHKGLGTVGQPPAVLIYVDVKPVAPFRLERLGIGKDRSRGPDRGGGRQKFVHGGRQMRVVRQTVSQGFDCPLQRGDTALRIGQHIGPPRKAPGEFIGTRRLGRT